MAESNNQGGKPPRQFAKKILLALCSAVFTFAALEVIARIYVTRVASEEAFSQFASLAQHRSRDHWWFGLITPHRYLGYSLTPNFVDDRNRHNSEGYRGEEIEHPKPAGRFRIVCMGASTTYTIGVNDFRKTYPAWLEKHLTDRGYPDVEVINAGVPAWTSYESVINFHLRIQDLQPDLLIVHQSWGDIASRVVWPPEAYKGDNSGFLMPQLAYKNPPWYEQSTLIRILLIQAGLTVPHAAMGKSVYNDAPTNHYFEVFSQRFTGTFPAGIFTEVSVKQMLDANPPTYFKRNTDDLVLAAKARSIPIVLMSFHYSADAGPVWFGVEGFEEATIDQNEILKQIANNHGTPYFDIAAVFPKDTKYWIGDGIHTNEAGAELEGRLIADFLEQNGLVNGPKAPSAAQ